MVYTNYSHGNTWLTFIRQRKDRRIFTGSLYHAIPSHHFFTLTHCTCLVTFNLNKKITLITLPESNIAPEKMVSQKERIVFQPSIFGCYCYVRFRDPVSPIKNPTYSWQHVESSLHMGCNANLWSHSVLGLAVEICKNGLVSGCFW